MGYTVHGIDISETMLARAEARRAALPSELAGRLSFSHGDIRSVRTSALYDAVVSLFHVISYQTTNADLEAVFETASVHLQSGGLFLFDFWHGSAVLTQLPEVRIKQLEDRDIKIARNMAEPELHADEDVVAVIYTVFIEEKTSEKVMQIEETHRMRYLFLPEIELLPPVF